MFSNLSVRTPDWQRARIGTLGYFTKGRGGSRQDDEPAGAACVRYGDLYKHKGPVIRQAPSRISRASVSNYTRLRVGDVLFALSGESREEIGISSAVRLDEIAYCGGDTAIFSPSSSLLSDFAAYYLTTPQSMAERTRAARGDIISHISIADLKRLDILVPNLVEQAAIVKYLGHAHARIGRAIVAKRRLIALLEEQKQAIIHQAVTRGLDPDVHLKDSGMPWLGPIPAHWRAPPIGRISRVGNGSTPARSTPAYWVAGDYPWLNSSFANKGVVTEADQFVTPVALAECHLPIVRSGSVLVGITGQGKTRGKAALLKIEATINQHLAYITPNPGRVRGEYLQAVLGAAYAELRRISDDSGSTKGALTCQDLKAFRIPTPPLLEQAAIVEAIAAQSATADATVAHAQREIALLQEFRTRLTSDVVTGQVDVREIAASLPDLTDEQLAEADDANDPLDNAEEYLEGAEVT